MHISNSSLSYPTRQFGIRTMPMYDTTDLRAGLHSADSALARGEFLTALDWYDQLLTAHPQYGVEILNQAYRVYSAMPDTTHSRYEQYQARHIEFAVQPHETVLALITSKTAPAFPLATHYVVLRSLTAKPVRNLSRTPIGTLHGKPLYEGNAEYLPFEEQSFDVVYCSHILQHTENPDTVCFDLMRIAKRGYIETPTRSKDMFLNLGNDTRHHFAVDIVQEEGDYGLVFTPYTGTDESSIGHDILLSMHTAPQTDRERALSALLLLRADRINTMFCWQGDFFAMVRNPIGSTPPRADEQTMLKIYNMAQKAIERQEIEERKIAEQRASLPAHLVDSPSETSESFVFLNTYHPGFIDAVYRRLPDLAQKNYQTQLTTLLSEHFGDSYFYSHGIESAGYRAQDIIANALPLQHTWCHEQGMTPSGNQWDIALSQIAKSGASVLYVQDMNATPVDFLLSARHYVSCLVGQIATPIEQSIPFHMYDIVFSSFPHYVERLRAEGLKALYQPLAFDQHVASAVDICVPHYQRRYAVSFVGGISPYHTDSLGMLEALSVHTPIAMFGYGVDSLLPNSPIRARHHGEAWGNAMFDILAQSKITINRHSPIADRYANNMRLFEATGCGALLITDHKDNLADFFEIGTEIITYRSPEECVELTQYYVAHPEEAEKIARAGQERTLHEHTYIRRMAKTAEYVHRHLRLKKEQKREQAPIDYTTISYGHQSLSAEQVQANTHLLSAWQDASIPARQRQLVNTELADMYRGNPPKPFTVLCDLIRTIVRPDMTFLDIGCASGYYYEGLEYLLRTTLRYTGTDYSSALIDMAKDYYPRIDFAVADGTNLPYDHAQFDIAMSSGVLLVVENPSAHIAEAARVSKRWVVLHRIPICYGAEIRPMKKFAYGVETFEQILPLHLIEQWLRDSGLHLTNTIIYEQSPDTDTYWMSFLAEKVS